MKNVLKQFINNCKQLNGDPHYIAMGMAIGIFVSLTPFFPFHTALAVTTAIILRGSKRAAAVGVWLSNPITIPFCYYVIYKTGIFLMGVESVYNPAWKTFSDIVQMGLDVVCAMILGGAVLGIVLAIPAYVITKAAFKRIQQRNRIAAEKSAVKQGLYRPAVLKK